MQSSDPSFFDALRAGTAHFCLRYSAVGLRRTLARYCRARVVGVCPIQLGLSLPAGEPD